MMGHMKKPEELSREGRILVWTMSTLAFAFAAFVIDYFV